MPKTDNRQPVIVFNFLLLGCGLAALYSASTVESLKIRQHHRVYFPPWFTAWVSVRFWCWFFKIDYHKWQNYSRIILVSLTYSLSESPGIGFLWRSYRWIHVGPLFFQPAELAKLAIVLYLAAWAAKAFENGFCFGLLPSLIIIGLLPAYLGTGLGTMSVALCIAVLCYLLRASLKHFLAEPGWLNFLLMMIKIEPYRWQGHKLPNPGFDPRVRDTKLARRFWQWEPEVFGLRLWIVPSSTTICPNPWETLYLPLLRKN